MSDGQAMSVPPTVVPLVHPFGIQTPEEPLPVMETRSYINKAGEKTDVQVAGQNEDGSYNILLPAQVGTIRRDGVKRKATDADRDCIE